MTLKRHLPGPEVAELATKADLVALGERLAQNMDSFDQRLGGVEQWLDGFDQRFLDLHTALREHMQFFGVELRAQGRSFALTSIASTTTVVAAVFVAAAVF